MEKKRLDDIEETMRQLRDLDNIRMQNYSNLVSKINENTKRQTAFNYTVMGLIALVAATGVIF